MGCEDLAVGCGVERAMDVVLVDIEAGWDVVLVGAVDWRGLD